MCPSMDKWIKKMWHTHTVTKMNEILSFAATWIDLEGIMLSEMSDRERQIYDITYMWNLKTTSN